MITNYAMSSSNAIDQFKDSQLTEKQLEVYKFCCDFFEENDMIPSTRTIANHLGVWQTAAMAHVRALEKKNYFKRNSVNKLMFVRR